MKPDFQVRGLADILTKMSELFPDAKVIIAMPDIKVDNDGEKLVLNVKIELPLNTPHSNS